VQAERERLGLSDDDDGKLQGSAVSFEEIEPWPEPVNGAALLDEIATTVRSHVVMSDYSRDICALWIVHSYLIKRFMISPKLSIRSAVKGCGKTTLLDVLSHLVFRALVTGSITKAALFRIIDMWHPTLLIDEVDSFVGDDEELRGMLNNSHRYDGAVVRTVGDEHEPRRFSIYAAVALSGIGGLVDTLADRSVTTDLQRRRPNEPITQLRIGRMEHLHTLQRSIARWVADHEERIAERDPEMPAGVHNREADNWHVLLAIAEEAEGEWPKRAHKAAEAAHIAAANDDASWLELLLGDIRTIAKGKVQMASADLVKDLIAIEGRPWAEQAAHSEQARPDVEAARHHFGNHPRRRQDAQGLRL
jgi:putative DNA primase/helicase